MTGSLRKILDSLPLEMVLMDRARTWTVSGLLASLRDAPAGKVDERVYVLNSCHDGRQAIVLVEASGSLAKTASYMQVV